MLKTLCTDKNLSRLLVFSCTCLLVIFFALPWVNAKEAPKPKLQEWQLNGILVAVDDVYPGVQGTAFDKLGEYELKSLDKQTAENLAKKAAAILKDNKIDSYVRRNAASALGNLGEAAKPYIPDILAFLKDDKFDAYFRPNDAASALGKLGEAAKPYIPNIVTFLKDDKIDASVRSRAASELGKLGEAAKPYIPDIVAILKDDKIDSTVRVGAASALGNFGEAAKSYIPDILAFLKDDKLDASFRAGAASALGNFGEAAKSYIPDIVAIIKDDKLDASFRARAASALGNFGEAAKPYIPVILAFLKDDKANANVRASAASALGNLGLSAKPYIPNILAFLKDDKINSDVRSGVASALGNLGEAAKPYIPDIVAFLKDDKIDANVRAGTASVLGNLGEAAKSYIPDILAFLKDDMIDAFVQSDAESALGNFGETAKPYIPDILAFLKNDKVDANVRRDAASALAKIGQLSTEQVIAVLNLFYRPGESGLVQYRFLTYFITSGTDEVKTLLKYLGHYDRKKAEAQLQKLNHNEAKKALNLFAQIWKPSEGMHLRNDLAQQIAEVADRVTWNAGDIALLQTHYSNLRSANYKQYDTIGRIIQNLEYWKWIFAARNTILIHLAVWLLLIFAYPKSPQIQAIFFWNPWVRRILGMFYVGFLLTWVPFFRRKLLKPFKPSLLADAGLDNFNLDSYFPESNVQNPMGDILPITQALGNIKGQIILEGDSGLGKSMFLRYLAKNSQRIIVFLPAFKCEKGVSEAIQAKLHGQAQDANFLQSLIYSGAIDIYIDGINEVSAETRVKICEFVEKHFRGNVIMTTQPLEWIAPSTAKTYKLQPLTRQQIEQFLIERASRLGNEAKITGDDYKQACKNYLVKNLDNQLPSSELDASLRILSNPMDLSLVSTMISQGQHPELFNLLQQQYNLMSTEYKRKWKRDFPLKKFSTRVYQQRCYDETALPVEEFNQEIMSMEDEKYKMVIRREWSDVKYGIARKEWNFRHDKIMEFFSVQNFLDGDKEAEERQDKHMGDSRFRGVYFALATLLPLDKAHDLREKLIKYAVNTKDYTVMGTYEQILQARVMQP
jgi:HEAT repeat protein